MIQQVFKPTRQQFPNFGTSVANIGDFDGDGINELAVGTSNQGKNIHSTPDSQW